MSKKDDEELKRTWEQTKRAAVATWRFYRRLPVWAQAAIAVGIVGFVIYANVTYEKPANDAAPAVVEESEPAPESEPGAVSDGEYGAAWPLSVPYGVLRCEAYAVTFETSDGTTYAVNGAARGRGPHPDIDPIWLDDPDNLGAKKDIGPLIDRGLALCE